MLDRLSRLSVRWLKLGIALERIEPGKPQRNGRLERCHLTPEDAVTPSAADLIAQRRVIDEWRRGCNEDRPHEALGDGLPSSTVTSRLSSQAAQTRSAELARGLRSC